ncbi:MAG: hypothetical protein IIZ12_00840, partial [Eggerthellaceae bacterium]|nr:hypothetical protein [Eggerthellaceae bacterium]
GHAVALLEPHRRCNARLAFLDRVLGLIRHAGSFLFSAFLAKDLNHDYESKPLPSTEIAGGRQR